MKRRNFIKLAGVSSLAIMANPLISSCNTSPKSNFKGHVFDALPYAYNALEPYIDAETMELHYSKHHQGYFNKFTKEIENTELTKTPMHEIFKNIGKYSSGIRNNGGGYYNHSLFWKNLSPTPGSPNLKLTEAIDADFGSMDKFKDEFFSAAKTQFGSGWAWLVLTPEKKLKIGNTPNQDNPLMPLADIQGIPLIAFDVWEHAYYLNYQNKRGDYIHAFWNIINWSEVSDRYLKAMNGEWIG